MVRPGRSHHAALAIADQRGGGGLAAIHTQVEFAHAPDASLRLSRPETAITATPRGTLPAATIPVTPC